MARRAHLRGLNLDDELHSSDVQQPRAATSVATRMSNLASLNALRVACTDGASSVSMHGLDCKAESRLQPGVTLHAKTLGLQPHMSAYCTAVLLVCRSMCGLSLRPTYALKTSGAT